MYRLLSVNNIPKQWCAHTELSLFDTTLSKRSLLVLTEVTMLNLRKKSDRRVTIKKESKWFNIVKKQAVEFCLETGLHGYKYIVQAQRSKTERIIWAIVVFLSLSCAIVLMKLTWDYYVTHPTLTLIESTHHGIWNYPFPAVTVCDINRVSLNLTQQLVEKLKLPANMSKEFVIQEMRLLNELIDPGVFGYDVQSNLTRLQDIFDYSGLTIPAVIHSVTRGCDDFIESCRWKGSEVNCSQIVETRLSRNGLCCSFNYISAENKNYSKNTKPRRVTACGYQTGITMLLKFQPDDYHATTFGTIGAKVLIHNPHDYPDYNSPFKLVGFGRQVFLTIEPDTTYSMQTVKNLGVSMRDCIFDDEADQYIATFKERNFTFIKYSYLNCLVECRSSIVKRQCGCIPYYIPQNSSRVCTLRDIECLKKYRFWYDTSWPGAKLSSEFLSNNAVDISTRPCGCLPDCNFYRYTIEISQGALDGNVYHVGLSYTRETGEGQSLQNYSVLHVFFGDLMSTQYRRHVFYNWRNLFASFGGLLGLFAGFSLMSVFELIYFFIIRVIVDACTNKQK